MLVQESASEPRRVPAPEEQELGAGHWRVPLALALARESVARSVEVPPEGPPAVRVWTMVVADPPVARETEAPQTAAIRIAAVSVVAPH